MKTMLSAVSLMPATLLLALPLAVSPAGAAVIHVPADYSTIALAIANAAEDDTIMIACNTYHEHGLGVPRPMTIVSETGDPACAIIDGDDAGRVMTLWNADGSVIEGITFTGGRAEYGAGLFVSECSATITSCIFADNYATIEGGGLTCTRDTVHVTDCRFIGNGALNGSGGSTLDEVAGTFTDCTFTGNTAKWGAGATLYRQGATAHFEGCVFENNTATGEDSYGGGVYCYSGAQPTFTNCTFTGNDSDEHGGAVCLDLSCAAEFEDCVFTSNTANWGGGVYVWMCGAGGFTDCTFDANGGGSSIYASNGADLAVIESIMAYGTIGQAAYTWLGSSVTCADCDVYENAGGDWTGCLTGQDAGDGNLCVDPRFCGIMEADLTLCSNSPCLAANNGGIGIGATLEGCGECTSPVAVSSWGVIKAMYRQTTIARAHTPAAITTGLLRREGPFWGSLASKPSWGSS